jgi:S1-C subfamily serine protease
MILMLRALVVLATIVAVVPPAAAQAVSVLHIKVVLVDADRKATPVARHALLISDNPASAPPRRIVTTTDGSADVRLPPGNYTVESDNPVVFQGKTYQWTQTLDIVAGRDAVLELTAANAEIGAVGTGTASGAPLEADPWLVLSQWQDSVVALWTPTTHASGFVIGANGLVATSRRALSAATAVEVQVSSTVKVAARILVADPVRDVAVLWIDPTTVASVRPVPLGCALEAKPPVVDGQKIFAIEVPLLQQKGTASGTVSRLEAHAFVSDFALSSGGAGGPVFTESGGVIGITSVVDERTAERRGNSRVVRIGDVCEVVATAEQKIKGASPPIGTRLPIEPLRPFPVEALESATQVRAGSLSPYQMSSSDFDIAFMTPVQTYGAQHQSQQSSRNRGRGGPPTDMGPAMAHTLTDFSNWSRYVADFPPVLLVRVTPKMVEGFWTKVARGAAQTQGVALPPMKHFKSGFSRMRAFCGDTEVTPIHPFKLEERVSETDAISEGLYVFDPGALAPSCGTVKIVLYSEKEPEKGDTLVLDAKVVQQIWQDFEPYRALN